MKLTRDAHIKKKYKNKYEYMIGINIYYIIKMSIG